MKTFSSLLTSSLLVATFAAGCAASSDESAAYSSPSSGSTRALGSQFSEQEVDTNLVVAVAVNEPTPSLMLFRQIPRSQKCWNEQGHSPTTVDPLLLNFDHEDHCVLAEDEQGYGVRLDGVESSTTHRLEVRRQGDDLVLVATSPDETLTVARTQGLASGKYVKLQLEKDWRITLQRQGRKSTGLMYLSRSTGPRDTDDPGRGPEGSGGSSGEGGSTGTGGTPGGTGGTPSGTGGTPSGTGGTPSGTGGSETSGCGTITLEGQCDANTLTWCESNELRTLTCTDGKTCGWNAEKSYYDCMADSVPTCGSVTAEGTCDGSTVTWCDSGQLRSFDCATKAQTCGWNDTKSYYDCVAPPATGCGSVSVTGVCTGTVLQWCELGQLQTLDCSTTNQVCGWSDTYEFYDCI